MTALRDDVAAAAFLLRLQPSVAVDDANSLAALLGAGQTVSAKRELGTQGPGGQRIMILTSGWACRYKLLRDGRRLITMLLLPGDVCNPNAVDGHAAGHGVASLTACTVGAIDPADLRSLMTAQPSAAMAWIGLLEADRAMLAEQAMSLGRRSARERLAHLLCELFVRASMIGRADADSYFFPITQEEIGDALGLTSVHTNRTIRALRDAGLFSIAGQRVTIHDWDGLCAAGEFDGRYLHRGGGASRSDGVGTRRLAMPAA